MNLYCITFPNHKKYVGVETRNGKRWYDHCNPSKGKKLMLVQIAIQKYGKENCKFEYLYKGVTRERCLFLEECFIYAWNLTDRNYGYNICEGGSAISSENMKEIHAKNPNLRWIQTRNCYTEESRNKQSASRMGKKWESVESLQRRSIQMKADYSSGKRKAFISHWTPEQKIEISNRLKSQYASGQRTSRKGLKRTDPSPILANN